MSYGIRRELDVSYEDAVRHVRETLQKEGFGVLTEIDLKAKLKEKLGVEFGRYVILGACNPPLAYRALQAEPEIGLLLPCNVVVYEVGERRTVVSAIDPASMAAVVGPNPAVEEVARDAEVRLRRAIAAL
jgi:uncharacterized protein (DUF302 family)